MTVALILAAAFLGIIIGWCMKVWEDDCPRAAIGYDCRGEGCDHRKSELYRNKMNMALQEEELEANKSKNLWGGS